MIDLQLEGKTAIVTGASRGLGRATAIALHQQGVRVLAVARSLDDLKTLEELDPQSISACQCDMQDASAVATLAQAALDQFGGLDIVVNNAGIAPAGNFLEQAPEIWDQYGGKRQGTRNPGTGRGPAYDQARIRENY